jgi:hypothetical protein
LDGFISLGLCIVSVNELAIAILMTFKAFSNEQHIKRSFGVTGRKQIYYLNTNIYPQKIIPQVQTLESEMEAAYGGSTPASPIGLSGSGGGGTGGRVQPLLAYNSRVVPANSYSLLAYDSLTQSASGKLK